MRPQRSTRFVEKCLQAQWKGQDHVSLTFGSLVIIGTIFKKLEEIEFVVESGASMHMLNKKDLSSAEPETLQRSRNPTTVITANGEVQTNEEATENAHDLEFFANTSHDSDSQRLAKVATRKHSIKTHFPKDRNCEICRRTKITRAPCRRRTGNAVHRAEKVRWLDNRRSKSSQWRWCISKQSQIRSRGTRFSYSMDTVWSVQKRTSQQTERSSRKFLGPPEKPKVIYTDHSLEFGNSCEDTYHGIIVHQRFHRSETNGIWKIGTQNKRRDVCCTVICEMFMTAWHMIWRTM